jgi:type I restriction enzyme S subunit
MKYVLSNNDGGVWGGDIENEEDGNIVIRSTEITIDGNWDFSNPLKRVLTENEVIKSKLYEGDIVITKSSGSPQHIGKSVIVSKEIELLNCCYSNFVQRIRFRNYNPKLYHFILNSDIGRSQFKYLTTSSTGLGNLNGSSLNDILLPFIPLQEQEQIVNYLDEKTIIIDKLISTKERKVELLKEQRNTLINQVITKGLNPNVKMKDSGVEWVDEIPEGWCVGKLKNYSELRISSVDKHIYEYERQVIVCNYTDVYYNEFITNELELRKGSCSEDEYNKFKLNKGDVIITKDSESPMDIGVPSLVNDDFENVVCGYHLSIIKPLKNKLIGGFLFRQLQTKRIRSYYEICSNGITRFGLGKSSVLETPLIIPPIQEQEQIVEYLDKHTKEIDDLVSMEQKKIELLKEYRQSLISEVITGKIKVV